MPMLNEKKLLHGMIKGNNESLLFDAQEVEVCKA